MTKNYIPKKYLTNLQNETIYVHEYIEQDNKHEITLIKCIKFYQITYFDVTPLLYNHLIPETFSFPPPVEETTKLTFSMIHRTSSI